VKPSPQGRADVVKDFVEDGFPIFCASIHAMTLGHKPVGHGTPTKEQVSY